MSNATALSGPTTEQLLEMTRQEAAVRELRIKLNWEATDCDEAARAFWESCALQSWKTFVAERAVIEADAMLAQWRKRFDPRAQETRQVEKA